MNYYYLQILKDINFDEAVEKTVSALQKEGFGVLTEIDLKSVLKKKLDINFYKYKILGACNPEFAYKALKAEDKIGTMLPCNVIVQEKELGIIEVSAVNPLASMQAVQNKDLQQISEEVALKLENAIKNIFI